MYAISKMDINKTRNITSFISSKKRQLQENTYDFTIDYPDGILACRPNEYMELNVWSFDMANTMYNINETNNKFEIMTNNIPDTKTIPPGNYSVKTFMKKILQQTIIHIQTQNLIRANIAMHLLAQQLLPHSATHRNTHCNTL